MIDPIQIFERYYPTDTLGYRILLTHSQQVAELALEVVRQHPELACDERFVYEGAMLHDIGIYLTDAPIDSVAPPADTTAQPEIFTTVTLGNGDYLARYARRYLGRSEYWIYIYLANKEQIEDPDNIPLGTEIKIPTPQSVGIIGNEETDLAEAKRLTRDYYSHTAH